MDERGKDLQSALNYAYFYLNFRPRSKKEMADYLTKKAIRFGWTKEIVDQAILNLEEEKLIDDMQFIDWYVNQKTARKPKSIRLMKMELTRFGVDKNLTENFFLDNNHDEEKSAKEALEKRWGKWSSLDKRERFKKAASFLQRRGFNYDVIKKIIANFNEKNKD